MTTEKQTKYKVGDTVFFSCSLHPFRISKVYPNSKGYELKEVPYSRFSEEELYSTQIEAKSHNLDYLKSLLEKEKIRHEREAELLTNRINEASKILNDLKNKEEIKENEK